MMNLSHLQRPCNGTEHISSVIFCVGGEAYSGVRVVAVKR
jgi:hypothetical protein